MSWFKGNTGFELGFDRPLDPASLDITCWTVFRSNKVFEVAMADALGSSVTATGALTAVPAPSDHVEYDGLDPHFKGASGTLVAAFGYP